ncbi:MAG TPA: hypothetical protein VMH32_20025 [Burkholderiales bacterium]|nr:hypothetical protein [Burkholderiales bacterium]
MRQRCPAAWLLAAVLCAAVSNLGAVHADEANGSGLSAPHGGQMCTAGSYHLELVAGKGEIRVYVTDRSGRPIETAGGRGKAVVHTDGKGVTIPIQPVPGNLFEGKGRFRLKRSSVIFVTVHLRGAKPQKCVFRPVETTPIEPAAPGRT